MSHSIFKTGLTDHAQYNVLGGEKNVFKNAGRNLTCDRNGKYFYTKGYGHGCAAEVQKNAKLKEDWKADMKATTSSANNTGLSRNITDWNTQYSGQYTEPKDRDPKEFTENASELQRACAYSIGYGIRHREYNLYMTPEEAELEDDFC